MKNSYFMRVICRDEDKANPILIKIPMSILSPSPNMLRLLVALEEFYGVECYLTITNIEEFSDEKIGLMQFGVATLETMLVTIRFDDDTQFLCGITSASGEYELLALSEGRYFGLLLADQNLVNYLGLEYIKEVTDLHREYLESIDCGDSQEYVYFPSALYD